MTVGRVLGLRRFTFDRRFIASYEAPNRDDSNHCKYACKEEPIEWFQILAKVIGRKSADKDGQASHELLCSHAVDPLTLARRSALAIRTMEVDPLPKMSRKTPAPTIIFRQDTSIIPKVPLTSDLKRFPCGKVIPGGFAPTDLASVFTPQNRLKVIGQARPHGERE